MIITIEVLKNFKACEPDIITFGELFPTGIDISGLWGTKEEAEPVWKMILAHDWLKRRVGWGIRAGLIPARIRVDLRGADLSDADLGKANLQKTDLREANLREANLPQVDLWEANLREANLYGAHLRGADLSETDLRGADLRGANLWGADLRGADLRNAKHNKHTTWPAGFVLEEKLK